MEAPGEKLILRMWETLTDKGIGSLLRPWQMRREGRAAIDMRQEEMLRLAQAEADANAIRAGTRRLGPAGELLPVASVKEPEPSQVVGPPADEPRARVLKTVTEAIISDATRREVNIARSVLFAEEDLSDTSVPPEDQPVSEQPVDTDWLFRWRDAASEVSTEELQHLWGRVLAGEVRNPGTFSLRTLEFLRNISKDEADAINTLSRFALVDIVYTGDSKLFEEQGLSLAFLMSLQDLGIISGVGGLGLTVTLESRANGSYERLLMAKDRLLIIGHEDGTKKLTLPAFLVTRLGRQVCSLGTEEPSEPYLRSLGREIAGQGFRVLLARGFQLPDGRVRYFGAEPISAGSEAV